MESRNDHVELEGEQRRDDHVHVGTTASTSTLTSTSTASSSSVYRLFGRQKPVHYFMGGGKAADVILWKRWRISCGIIVVATVMWLLFERSGLPFLTLFSDVILILVVLLYVRSNHETITNKQSQELPELAMSEEIIHSAAASFRVKLNNMLIVAHDITLGKDFSLFLKVVVFLWLFSIIGSLFSFITLVYIGTIFAVTLPALYSRYEEHVDKLAGFIHNSISRRYTFVDKDE